MPYQEEADVTIHIVDHPLIKHKLGFMRKHDVTVKDFRDLASELASLLTYEATKDLETEKKTIQGWAGSVEVERIKGKKITVVPKNNTQGRSTTFDGLHLNEGGGFNPG